jgi:hypothetical protein
VKGVLGAIVGLLILFSVTAAVLIVLGVAIAFLLSAVLPGVDLAAGIVAGAIFAWGAIDLLQRLASTFLMPSGLRSDEDDDDEFDDEMDDDEDDELDDEMDDDEDDDELDDEADDSELQRRIPPYEFHQRRKSKRKKSR